LMSATRATSKNGWKAAGSSSRRHAGENKQKQELNGGKHQPYDRHDHE
jgi:hypothetical protein